MVFFNAMDDQTPESKNNRIFFYKPNLVWVSVTARSSLYLSQTAPLRRRMKLSKLRTINKFEKALAICVGLVASARKLIEKLGVRYFM